MALTDYQVIKDRIKSAYLPNVYKYLYQQMVYALGQETAYQSGRRGMDGDDPWGDGLLYFPAIEILDIIKGHSRRPLNAQYIMQSRVMGEMPEPMFPQLDPFSSEIRKQYCLNRDQQNYGLGEWFPHLTACFNEADALGFSGVQVGQKTDPLDQRKTVWCQQVSCLNTLWDPLVPHPSQSSWVAVMHYMTPDEVHEAYGGGAKRSSMIDTASKPAWQSIRNMQWKVCRVIEYFDVGAGKGEPTYAVVVGNVDGKGAFVVRQHNTREEIPVAFMVNFVAPGMSRPVGRVHLQLQSSKMINLLENYMFHNLAVQPDIDLVFADAIHPDDWKDLQSGKPMAILRLTKPLDRNMWHRIEKKAIPRTVMEMLDYYVRQYTEDSGLSELDRGVSPQKVRSATELGLINEKSQLNQGWIPRETMRFMVRFFQRIVRTARFEDDKPIMLDYKGNNIFLNDPATMEQFPNLRVEKFMEEFSLCYIDQMALSASDDESKRQRRLGYLTMLRNLQIPVDEQWFTEEWLYAGGQDDPKTAMAQTGSPMSGMNPAALQVATTGQAPSLPMGA